MRSLKQMAGYALCSILFIFFSGCAWATVHGVKPVYPASGFVQAWTQPFPATVESLQPELRWKGDALKKYDLAIWNTILVDNIYQRRKIIYEKTGLNGTVHKVGVVLNPDSLYYWSVRETGSEAWSTVTFYQSVGWVSSRETDMFKFSTPKTK